jgi:prepilin-type N-terminal cleavage/methylation domain-containing protein
MMKYMNKRGFTLIELLVVIAIIGILASVVLASLNSAREKGRDASARASTNNIRAAAEVFYDDQDPHVYDGMCTDAAIDTLLDAAQAQTGIAPDCFDVGQAYAVEIELNNGDFFCVDSTGAAETTAASAALADASPVCDGV